MQKAVKHLHLVVYLFLFFTLAGLAVVYFSTSKAAVITAAILSAINFTLFTLSLIFSLCVNSGEKIITERELSSLFGKNVKIK